jgi:hypothetical protein
MSHFVNVSKNRERDPYSFANINLLGKCNVDCFFCLGKDIEDLLSCHNQLKVHFSEWLNFKAFLRRCRREKVRKLYVTGQNTDSLLYKYLEELIDYLHEEGFDVGLRTNGYLADRHLDVINRCELSVGYSVHTLSPMTNKMIMGRSDFPNWDTIIPFTNTPRVAIVLNRCNEFEFFEILKFLSTYKRHLRYVQVRRPSTDTRVSLLAPDIAAYERVYTQVASIFGPPVRRFVTDAEQYVIYDMPVVFWRTTKTSVNSLNYFTDGTCSDSYFIVEGYLRNSGIDPNPREWPGDAEEESPSDSAG